MAFILCCSAVQYLSALMLWARLSRGMGEMGAGQGLDKFLGEKGQPEATELRNAPRLGFVVFWQGLLLVCTLVFITIHLSHKKSATVCCSANVAGLCRASLRGSQL